MWCLLVASLMSAAHAEDTVLDTLSTDDGWTFVSTTASDEGDIEMWRKEIDGRQCLRVEMHVTEFTPAEIFDVASDVDGLPEGRTTGITVSRSVDSGEGWVDFYQVMEMPFWTFMSDRYWALRAHEYEDDDGTLRFEFAPASETVRAEVRELVAESHSDAIELDWMYGAWRMSPEGEGTHMRNAACGDLGGTIPAAVQDWAMTTVVPRTAAAILGRVRTRLSE